MAVSREGRDQDGHGGKLGVVVRWWLASRGYLTYALQVRNAS